MIIVNGDKFKVLNSLGMDNGRSIPVGTVLIAYSIKHSGYGQLYKLQDVAGMYKFDVTGNESNFTAFFMKLPKFDVGDMVKVFGVKAKIMPDNILEFENKEKLFLTKDFKYAKWASEVVVFKSVDQGSINKKEPFYKSLFSKERKHV